MTQRRGVDELPFETFPVFSATLRLPASAIHFPAMRKGSKRYHANARQSYPLASASDCFTKLSPSH